MNENQDRSQCQIYKMATYQSSSIHKLSARQFEALDNRSFVLNVLCVMEYNVGKASVSVLWFWAESYVSWAVTNSRF